MVDLHRHTEYSGFDGFGKCMEVAKRAKELGYTSLSITDHGTTTGWVQHWKACKEHGLKPIFGVECYFLPIYNEDDKEKPTHLCLYAKTTQGIKNINKILSLAEEQKYYYPIVTFDLLESFSDGVMCSSACVGGYLARCIKKGDKKGAINFLQTMQSIYKDDFYIEVQPYEVTEKGLQEYVNKRSMQLAKMIDIEIILTSDSHFVRKEDLPTYLKMHEIAKHTTHDIEATYKERYMPSQDELEQRFVDMHPESQSLLKRTSDALQAIEGKVDPLAFDGLQPQLPKIKDAKQKLISQIKKGLTQKGKTNEEYIERVKHEVEVIVHHGYCEYFLMVAEYVQWAKDQGIVVGAGRGSGCNSLVNYALSITDVDPILYDLDFSRFLRKDKKKMPDIDVDFQTSRRDEVLEYLTRNKEQSAQICSYGLYKSGSLVNDLAKVCGADADEAKEIKEFIKQYESEQAVDVESLSQDKEAEYFNRRYDNIITHFCKLYGKVRYIGTHAAGVAIVDGDVSEFSYIKKDKDGKKYCVYDLADLEAFGVIKFDILGLQTLDTLDALAKATGDTVEPEKATKDAKTMEAFAQGETDGVFQFERKTAKKILQDVKADTIQDIIATNAMNRPAPLMLKIPKTYAESKREAKPLNPLYGQYLTATYGCILYQEQVQAIAVNIGGLSWADADTIIKSERGSTGKKKKQFDEIYERCLIEFVKGATAKGMTKEEAEQIYDNFYNYAFNRGHATGYSIISAQEMYYKVHYPLEYWATKLRQEQKDERQRYLFKKAIVQSGIVILPPRHNGLMYDGVTTLDGEKCIQEGIQSIKGIGGKAVEAIEAERNANGLFEDVSDFETRCRGRAVTSRTVELLVENSVFDYSDDNFLQRIIKYNASLM